MNNNTIANKLKEYHQTFLKLGINNYFSYNDDNNEMKAFEPLCNYFGCKPIYDWNDLSSDRIIDQIGHFICNKGENGILSLVWSAPLCGETEYQCKTLDEFKNAVREFNLN
jgi:hypothetical protein